MNIVLPNAENNQGVIYCTTNLINGKKYIGQDCNNNPRYLGSGKIFNDAKKLYGRHNFEKEILEYVTLRQQLNESEIYWVDYFNAQKSDLFYNIAPGGNCPTKGIPMTEEAKAHLSKLNKGKGVGIPMNFTAEQLAKISATHKGKKLSEKQKESLRNSRLGCKLSEGHKKKIAEANRGRVVSEETRLKISKAHTGRKISEETRAKMKLRKISDETRVNMSLAQIGKKQAAETVEKRVSKIRGHKMPLHVKEILREARAKYIYTDEVRQKMSLNKIGRMIGEDNHKSVKINQLDLHDGFIRGWASINSAHKALNMKSKSSITNVLSGKANTAYGFKWEYKK